MVSTGLGDSVPLPLSLYELPPSRSGVCCQFPRPRLSTLFLHQSVQQIVDFLPRSFETTFCRSVCWNHSKTVLQSTYRFLVIRPPLVHPSLFVPGPSSILVEWHFRAWRLLQPVGTRYHEIAHCVHQVIAFFCWSRLHSRNSEYQLPNDVKALSFQEYMSCSQA
jgi:hypothetical protein